MMSTEGMSSNVAPELAILSLSLSLSLSVSLCPQYQVVGIVGWFGWLYSVIVAEFSLR